MIWTPYFVIYAATRMVKKKVVVIELPRTRIATEISCATGCVVMTKKADHKKKIIALTL